MSRCLPDQGEGVFVHGEVLVGFRDTVMFHGVTTLDERQHGLHVHQGLSQAVHLGGKMKHLDQ